MTMTAIAATTHHGMLVPAMHWPYWQLLWAGTAPVSGVRPAATMTASIASPSAIGMTRDFETVLGIIGTRPRVLGRG